MANLYETCGVVALGLAVVALWKVTRVEKFAKPVLRNAGFQKQIAAPRRVPDTRPLPIPAGASECAVAFFQFYEDAARNLTFMQKASPWSFHDTDKLDAGDGSGHGAPPRRTIAIYLGEARVGRIILSLEPAHIRRTDPPEFVFIADLELPQARLFSGSDVEMLVELTCLLVANDEEEVVAAKRQAVERMARAAWQLGENASALGVFAERHRGNGVVWRSFFPAHA